MTRVIDDLPLLDVRSPAYVADPHTAYRATRDADWVARSERGCEVLAYEPIRRLLRDRRLYWPLLSVIELNGVVDGTMFEHRRRSLVNLRDDEHNRVRSAALVGLSRSAIASKRPLVRSVVEALLDELPTGEPFDFAAMVAQRVPATLFCLLMGSSVEDAPLLARLSLGLNRGVLRMEPAARAEIETLHCELVAWVQSELHQRRRSPGDDFISALFAPDSPLSQDEVVALVINIFQASVDSTANLG